MKEIILTGIRSNDEPTLGNYLGAMLPMVDLQRKHSGERQINMFVPDLHSFTTPIDYAQLHANTIRNLKYFVAAGLDINNPDTYVYRQSRIPAHSELTVILNNFTYVGELNRMTQFKEKSAGSDTVSAGLYDYPVLMAADILLYGARWVPVGDDQKQHLELTRDIGTRFNAKFGEIFALPEPWEKQFAWSNKDAKNSSGTTSTAGVRIRSLSGPTRKMRKSISDPRGTILLSDTPTDAAKKVISATTDSLASVAYDWDAQPGITNLLQILALLTHRPQADVTAEWAGSTAYGDLKKAVAASVSDFLTHFHTTYDLVDEHDLLHALEADEAAMSITANDTLTRVQHAVGLRQ